MCNRMHMQEELTSKLHGTSENGTGQMQSGHADQHSWARLAATAMR